MPPARPIPPGSQRRSSSRIQPWRHISRAACRSAPPAASLAITTRRILRASSPTSPISSNARSRERTMATTPMNLFVMLSSAVCGIAMDKLAPDIDPTDVKQAYFETAQKQASVAFAQLLNIVDRNASLPPDQLADLVLNKSGDDIR